ncbi:MAG TPA: malto-oligosyltrehalose synthase [Thermoanaerobaculia bacterium]
MYRVPVATYRLQFNASFRFSDGQKLVAYLHDLGISDLYSSPVLRARKGSMHGYDVVDASGVNPELGGEEEFAALQAQLRSRDMGFVLDIVPNHMAASPENGWWMSVLENGPYSRFFQYFDIDWVDNKVVLPILGKPYGEAIESQEVQLAYETERGLHFRYFDRVLPLSPESYVRVLGECVDALPNHGVGMELREIARPSGATDLQPQQFLNSRFLKETLRRLYEHEAAFREALEATIERINGEAGNIESFNKLDELLGAQWYRLAYWRIASEKINYRRFFDVADLVAVRVENPEVFEERHKRIFALVSAGHVTGLRIDHIDGLYDPAGHLRKLQMRLADSSKPDDKFYVVVEKILAEGEDLPKDFDCAGTTGYDFTDILNAVFIDPAGLARLTDFYRDCTGIEESFEQMAYTRKRQVIHELFSGEMRALGDRLAALAQLDRNARDFAPSELLAALTEITACMHVYRTYIRDMNVSEEDREYIHRAIACAREHSGTAIDDRIFMFLENVLTVSPPSYIASEQEHWKAFVMRWQQFTGRVMAKGVEDTAFYNYNRLIALNEVGGEPGRTGAFDPVEELHARNTTIARDWPGTMNATSTHDTKRSEDVRARLFVLSELAETWETEVRRWSKLNAPLRPAGIPDANEELLIYQTLLGMWPLDDEELPTVPERLRQYIEKASREAKTHTSWIAPNADYEKALLDYAAAVAERPEFREAFSELQKTLAFHGYLNALSQLVLKIASPGVPDFYQGTELWDFSLVDPDNRRPVDYDTRQILLRKLKSSAERGALEIGTLLRRWFDGRIKLYTTWKSLAVRARHIDTFRRGDYHPLRSDSPNLVAFARANDIAVAVPRLTTRLVKPGQQPLGDVWGDISIEAPGHGTWRNAFTGDTIEVDGDRVQASRLFTAFPVAILERER